MDGTLDDLVEFAHAALAADMEPRIVTAEAVNVRIVVSDGIEERAFLVGLADVDTINLGDSL